MYFRLQVASCVLCIHRLVGRSRRSTVKSFDDKFTTVPMNNAATIDMLRHAIFAGRGDRGDPLKIGTAMTTSENEIRIILEISPANDSEAVIVSELRVQQKLCLSGEKDEVRLSLVAHNP